MVCGARFKKTDEKRILSNDDILDLVYLKRVDPIEYNQVLRDIAEILRDVEEVREEVNSGKKYRINFAELKKAKEKGFCLCDAKKKEDGSNICPCIDFLKKGVCKCGVFT